MWKVVKKKKCSLCGNSSKNFHELRLNTLEGPHPLEICDSCADLFDKEADNVKKSL